MGKSTRKKARKTGARPAARSKAPRSALRVECESSLAIADAGALKRRLLEALEQGRPITMDVSDVRRVDTAALQVLVAFARTARRDGVAVSWKEPTPELLQAAGLLGLSTELEIAPQTGGG